MHLAPIAAVLLIAGGCPVFTAELVSILPNGTPYAPKGGVLSVSDDGRYVLFPGAITAASDGGSGSVQPLYVRDAVARTTVMITSQEQANGAAVISGDGSTIIGVIASFTPIPALTWFQRSGAAFPYDNTSQLIAGSFGPVSLTPTANGDTVVYAANTGVQLWWSYVQTRSTVTTHGLAPFIAIAAEEYASSISSDGQWAVAANGFATSDAQGLPDDQMALIHLATGQQTLLPGTREVWESAATQASVSGHGEAVAYLGSAPDGSFGVLVYDRAEASIQRVDVSAQGVEGHGSVANPTISLDGTEVGFISDATNLVAGVADGRWHAYVATTSPHAIRMVSLTAQGLSAQSSGVLSGNGQYLVGYSATSGVDPAYPGIVGGAYRFTVASGRR